MNEFMQFWSLGAEATLNLTTSGGTVKVEFNCTLGQPGAPHSLPPSSGAPFAPPPHRPRHRGPAARERNRLRAARHQAAQAEATDPVSSVLTSSSVSDSATDESSTDPVAPAVATTAPVPSKEIEAESDPVSESFPSFKCDQYSYTNCSEKGLGQHKRMRHRISQVDGFDDSYEEINEETNHVTLELDHLGNIVGPELAPNSSPPEKVYHPMAGIGLLRAESSVTSDGETYISYFFPDDPKTFIVTQGPNRGMRMDSNYDVFLRE